MEERFRAFTLLISKISRYIRKIKAEEMIEFELKTPHVSCLYYLYRGGRMTARELCDICEEDKAAISRSIEQLEESGYVYCETVGKKRYKSPLALTEKGKTVALKIADKIDGFMEKASVGLDEDSRIVLYKSLNLICDNLQKICEDYGE